MKKILLVHGIFMRPFVMSLFAKRLRKEGYQVETFGYPFFPTEKHVTDIFLQKVSEYKPHIIIGHSLGGSLVAHQLSLIDKDVETVICLGSPLAGSSIAKKIALGKISFLISKVANRMLTHEVILPTNKPVVGLIAGTKNTIGFRLLFPVLKGSNDGTVATEETKVANLIHRIEMPVGHTSMLWSAQVIREVIYFIERGHFSN